MSISNSRIVALNISRLLIQNNAKSRELITTKLKILHICLDGLLTDCHPSIKLADVRLLKAYFECEVMAKSTFALRRNTEVTSH